MEEPFQEQNLKSYQMAKLSRRSSEFSETCSPASGFTSNLKGSDASSSDEEVHRKKSSKRIKKFSDSDSDDSNLRTKDDTIFTTKKSSASRKSNLQASDGSESDNNISKSLPHKSRILGNISNSSESEDNERHHNLGENNLKDNEDQISDGDSENAVKNEEQQLRMKNKTNKLKNKFKDLLKTKGKKSLETGNNGDEVKEKSDTDSSSESGDDVASIDKIKQKINERMSFKSTICDPDTSDEESNQQKSIYKKKKERKIKLTSPKPQRMSAKQAMENMQKIKSESNRMLREKEVSLPYHRPKALSLKDIMSRRKLAVSADGKALPIKMNEDQLKHYAKMLEERQKEIIELCKSESEEEDPVEESANTIENSEEVLKDTSHNPETVDKIATENNLDSGDAVDKIHTENTNETSNVKNNINNAQHLVKDTEITSNIKEVDVSNVQDANHIQEEQDSENSMKLVYNDSADSIIDNNTSIEMEKINEQIVTINNDTILNSNEVKLTKANNSLNEDSKKGETERDSQLISLHLDTENTESFNKEISDITKTANTGDSTVSNQTTDQDHGEITITNDNKHKQPNESIHDSSKDKSNENMEEIGEKEVMEVDNEFSDDELMLEDIDNIIENAEIIKDIEDRVNSQFLVRDKPLNLNPILTGAPGMVIDLDDSDAAPKKSGVELLKERYIYFSKLKTPEEKEKERERKIKPGTQLNKLKQELEEKIAEQRSLEWAKRLEEEKQQQKELKELRGEESDGDDIDKIEAALEEKDEIKDRDRESSSGEEEPIEDDIEIKDKPRAKNAMVDDEAEESDCDEIEDNEDKRNENDEVDDEVDNDEENTEKNENGGDDGIAGDDDDEESESDDSDESSESEVEQTVVKKGRILKAFEDSDDEDASQTKEPIADIKDSKDRVESKSDSSITGNFLTSQIATEDDELQLAQRPKSTSDDLFSQDSVLLASETKEQDTDNTESEEMFTQTFSILDSSKPQTVELDLNSSGRITAVESTQSLELNNLQDSLYPVTDTQRVSFPSQIPTTQMSQSQPIGEDILALCTGQFYDNQFVSQVEDKPLSKPQAYDAFDNYQSQDNNDVSANTSIDQNDTDITNTEDFVELNTQDTDKGTKNSKTLIETKETDDFIELNKTESNKDQAVDDNLKSILDELADPDFDAPKPNKFFESNTHGDRSHTDIQMKRKLVIDSDEEPNENGIVEPKKVKKLKKKKAEKRALQISDDEEEQSDVEDIAEYESDIEEENVEKLVEYDSEENEIEVQPANPKKKRKMAEFFENEAELTSEDEWAGSGDEDEAGLDRMEREAGDDDTFHQGTLQRELGQIHMRDVLDQDKREVRIIQELLFEDGDLGGGGRQRKFRWNNMGGEEAGAVPGEFADSQEEEFESEEQWRKQRHEREMFLRNLKNKDEPDEILNVSINRTTIIKGNLLSKTMSTLLMEANPPAKTESPVEKKTTKDIPSPKKPFALLQHQNYQGSLLGRGRGALARLAALAAPLTDDDSKLGTVGGSRRNFVFTAVTPDDKKKVSKRRAESNPSTPNLVKKIRTEENKSKSSLLDHFKL